jgi:hypothetical protein
VPSTATSFVPSTGICFVSSTGYMTWYDMAQRVTWDHVCFQVWWMQEWIQEWGRWTRCIPVNIYLSWTEDKKTYCVAASIECGAPSTMIVDTKTIDVRTSDIADNIWGAQSRGTHTVPGENSNDFSQSDRRWDPQGGQHDEALTYWTTGIHVLKRELKGKKPNSQAN